MTEPEIEQLDQIDALDGAYGDYDAETHKIRILAPNLLYQLVLEHEKAHAKHRKTIGLMDSLNQMIRIRVFLALGVLVFITGSSFTGFRYGGIGFVFGMLLTVPVLAIISKAWNMLEEAMADRIAIREAHQPEGPEE
jgi:Zn-dependent protease with chaperone function